MNVTVLRNSGASRSVFGELAVTKFTCRAT